MSCPSLDDPVDKEALCKNQPLASAALIASSASACTPSADTCQTILSLDFIGGIKVIGQAGGKFFLHLPPVHC